VSLIDLSPLAWCAVTPVPTIGARKGVALTADGLRVRQTLWERLTNNSGPLGRLSSRQLADLRALLRSAMPGATPPPDPTA
jgi:hypothetical protein